MRSYWAAAFLVGGVVLIAESIRDSNSWWSLWWLFLAVVSLSMFFEEVKREFRNDF